MKFIEGMMLGGIIAVGATMMYNEMSCKSDAKKMMKKGKQFVKKMGLM
jgi:gas vesicle protein